ncbi:MAG: hypothetical protein V2J42_10555 [Wenzhouxiangella sp.]|jgi:hypothetical protein|nr:hypothetical protein [Wenzhouxiangella sp.]
MRKMLFSLCLALALGLLMGPAMSNDQCVMCHQDQKENAVAAHSNCAACHGGGAEAHLENFKEHPEPVTNDTCTTCHQPNDDFKAIAAHGMDMECSACHSIHEEG